MFGIVGNNVENVKFIGRRDMNMDANMKAFFGGSDKYYFYPYFNDAKEQFRLLLLIHVRVKADNKQK